MGESGLPYLGSMMSLITQQEVRYEGILENVNMAESSLVLRNVKCKGSEGRLNGVNEIPASEQVFESVIFNAGEIKDLTVLQSAPPAPYPGAPVPAAAAAPPPAASPWGPPSQAPPAPPAGQPFGASPWGAPAPPAPAAPVSAAAATKGAPAPAPTVAISSVPKQENGNAPRPRPVSYAHAAGGSSAPASRGGRGGPARGGRHGGRGGGRGHHHHGGAHHHHHHPPAPVLTIPAEEFNFEEALKKFNKEELLKGVAQEEPALAEAPKHVYKKDDFFDEISCEALEKLNIAEGPSGGRGRGLAAARRRTDMETFGRTAGRGRGGYGRGGRGGRGRGGRGGHHGQSNANNTAQA